MCEAHREKEEKKAMGMNNKDKCEKEMAHWKKKLQKMIDSKDRKMNVLVTAPNKKLDVVWRLWWPLFQTSFIFV